MPFSVRLPLSVVMTLLLISLLGCGEKKVVAEAGSKAEESQSCINCHQNQVSPVTGKVIADEWKLSHHNTSNTAGCADCHDFDPTHESSRSCNACHSGIIHAYRTKNPDTNKKCDNCHGNLTGGLFPTGAKQAHFNNSTSASYPASYVSSKYEMNCRACHNPHDTTTAMTKAREWAKSGHGDLAAGPYTSNDFKTYGSYKDAKDELSDSISPSATYPNAAIKSVCVRCHTSSGFIRYVTTGFTKLEPFAGKPEQVVQYSAVAPSIYVAYNAGVEPGKTAFSQKMSKLSPDYTRQAINCNVCHDDGNGNAYGYKLRNVNIGGGAVVYYNYSGPPGSGIKKSIRNNKITFQDAGASNMCVLCHSGRENGDIIKLADANEINFTSTTRVGAHSFVAASDLFRKSGFHFYSSAKQYQSDFAHDIIGLDQKRTLFGGTVTFDGLKADSRGYGPCIGCHVNSGTSHTFKPVNEDAGTGSTFITPAITTIVSRACANCHTGSHAWSTENPLQAKKEGYYYAIQALSAIISYVKLPTSSSTLSNWITGSTTKAWLKNADPLAKYDGQNKLRLAAYNMGAVFNQSLLSSDPGGFAHNSVYIKRLIYDSIDWLDNGKLDFSVDYAFKNTMATVNPATGAPYNASYSNDLQATLNALDANGWQKAYDWLLGESLGNRP